MSFDDIHLLKEEYRTLKVLYKNETVWLSEDRINNLEINHLVDLDTTKKAPFTWPYRLGYYRISDTGKRYFDYLQHKKRDKFFYEFRSWVTLAIAIAAFVLSLFSLVRPLGK